MAHLATLCFPLHGQRAQCQVGVERDEAAVLGRARSQSSELVKEFEFFMIVWRDPE